MKDWLFSGTANYYAKYRPHLPKEVTDYVKQIFSLDGTGTLIDIGCGTGQSTYPFAKYFSNTIAIDPDGEMLSEAIKAQPKGLSIEWQERSSDEITETEGPYRLALASRSFHWVDQYELLKKLSKILVPKGGIAIIGDGSFWTGKELWQEEVKKIIQEFLGEKRRAGKTKYQPPREPYIEMLSKSGYKKLLIHKIPIKRFWKIDEIIGYLYSTSFAAPHLLGNNKPHFESRISNTLKESISFKDGKFVEDVEFVVHTGFVNE